MERIIKLIENFEKSYKKDIDLNSLLTFHENLKTFLTLISQIIEEKKEADKLVKSEELLTESEEDFDKFIKEISQKFTKLIDLTKDIYTEKDTNISPKEVVILTINEFFQEHAIKNTWGIDLYNDILDDLKIKLETELSAKIVHDLLNIRGDIEEIQKIPYKIQQQLTEIQDFLGDIGKYYPKLIKKDMYKGLDMELINEIENLNQAITQNISEIPAEIENKLSVRYKSEIQFLNKLLDEVHLYEEAYLIEKEELLNQIKALKQQLKESAGATLEDKPKATKTKKVTKKKKSTKKKKK